MLNSNALPAAATLALAFLAPGCAADVQPADSEAEPCEGGKCEDPDAEAETPCASTEPDVVGCCWIEPGDSGDALACATATDAWAPAEITLLLDRYDGSQVAERIQLSGTTEPTRAWDIPGYPFDLETTLMLGGQGTVLGLGDLEETRRTTVEDPAALSREQPLWLRAPAVVHEAEVLHAYPGEVVFVGIAEGFGDGAPTQEVLLDVGARSTVPFAAAPGDQGLDAWVELRSALDPNTAVPGLPLRLEDGGIYRIDESGLAKLASVEEPAGDLVTTCRVARSEIPAPEGCVPTECPSDATDCEPVSCEPTIRDQLVCDAVESRGVDGVFAERGELVASIGDGETLELDPAAYPQTLEVMMPLSFEVSGLDELDDPTHRVSITLEGPTSAAELRLPFDVWEVELHSDLPFAELTLAPRVVELGFTRADRFGVLARDEIFEAPTTVLIAAPVGTDSLSADLYLSTVDNVVHELEVELRPGRWRLSADGLEPQ